MNREDALLALRSQPFDTDVQVNVGGFFIDVAGIRFDERRHAIVIELFGDDAEEALSQFLRAGRPGKSVAGPEPDD